MTRHGLAGKTVRLKHPQSRDGMGFVIEDWWLNVSGGISWRDAVGNPACFQYSVHVAMRRLPLDDRVVYGKLLNGVAGGVVLLVHETELGEVVG